MTIDELLALVLDPEAIQPQDLRNEIQSLLRAAQVSVGLGVTDEALAAFRRSGIPDPRPKVNRLVLVRSYQSNAFVFSQDGKTATIGLTLPLPMILRMLFIAALSEPEVLAGVRDIPYQRPPSAARGPDFWPALVQLMEELWDSQAAGWARVAPTLPRNENCAGWGDLAAMLNLHAMSFLLLHELGHFELKHLVGLTRSATVCAELDVIGGAAQPIYAAHGSVTSAASLSNEVLVRHANELEADRFAIAKLCNGFYRPRPAFAPIHSPIHLAMTAMSERSRARLWLVTVGLVFLLFYVAGTRRGTNSHPRPLFRLQNLFEFSREITASLVGLPALKDFDQGRSDAMHDLAYIARKLGIAEPFAPQQDDDLYIELMAAARAAAPRTL